MSDADDSDLRALWDYDDPAGSEARFRAVLDRDDLDRSVQVEALTHLGRAQGLQRSFDDAHRTLDEAESLPASDRGRIRVLLERGRVHRSSGDPDTARPLFHDAWELADRVGEEGLAVDAAHMVAIVSEPDEALAWTERALALAETSSNPDAQRWVGTLANNVGWVHHERGEAELALRWFERALAFRRDEGDVGRERIARWSVARCLRTLGRLDEALTMQQELAVELHADGLTDGFVDEEIGECLLELGRADAARPWFARAHDELARAPSLAESEPERLERLRTLGTT